MEDIYIGTPNAKQDEFLRCKKKYVAFGGARGGGKSWAVRCKAKLLAQRYPGIRMLLVRRTMPEIEANHLETLRLELAGTAVYRAEERRFVFGNGSVLQFGYCACDRDADRYQGAEYDVIFFDEATQLKEQWMRKLAACVRGVNGFPKRIYYTCNPGNVGHGWVKRLFIDRRMEDGERAEDYAFIPASIYDNEILLSANPEYLRALESLPEDMRRAHLYGDWDAMAGQYFRQRHVIAPFELPRWWRRFRSMDWGYNDPCCVLWHAVDGDGRVYTYRELYVRQRRADQVAQSIIKLSGDEDISYTVASPDMWQKRGAILKGDGFEGESLAELFARGGVPLASADNARIAGWQRVRGYMADGADGKPMWQAFDCCENLIRTLPMLMYSPHNREDAADGEDHAPEALRYGLMSRPNKSSIKEPPKRRAYDPFSSARPQKSFMNQ
mgnify:CR=1 FL=1